MLCNPFTTQHVEINFSFFTLSSLLSFSHSHLIFIIILTSIFLICRRFPPLRTAFARFHSLFCSWILFFLFFQFAIGYANPQAQLIHFPPLIAWRLCCSFFCFFYQGLQHWCEIWFGEKCREKIVSTIRRALVLGFDTVGDRMRFLHLDIPFVVFRLTSSAFLLRQFSAASGIWNLLKWI